MNLKKNGTIAVLIDTGTMAMLIGWMATDTILVELYYLWSVPTMDKSVMRYRMERTATKMVAAKKLKPTFYDLRKWSKENGCEFDIAQMLTLQLTWIEDKLIKEEECKFKKVIIPLVPEKSDEEQESELIKQFWEIVGDVMKVKRIR